MIGTLPPTIQPRQRRWRFDVADYVRLHESGIIPERARTELVEGEIRIMAPIGPDHGSAVITLNRLFVQGVGERAIVSPQNSLRLGDRSLLQPDIALLKPHAQDYADRHPTADDVVLVVEVSISSLRYDRRRKLAVYARHRVAEVWIVAPAQGVLEVHRAPAGGRYTHAERLSAGAVISPAALPDVRLAVSAILRRGEPTGAS